MFVMKYSSTTLSRNGPLGIGGGGGGGVECNTTAGAVVLDDLAAVIKAKKNSI